MAGLKSPIFLYVVLVIAFVVMAPTAEAQAQVCSTELGNLNVCAPFVVPGAANSQPNSDCCQALGAVSHDCLCNTLRIASRLPSLCNIPALACSKLFFFFCRYRVTYTLHITPFYFFFFFLNAYFT